MDIISSVLSSVTGKSASDTAVSQTDKKLQGHQLVQNVFPDLLNQVLDSYVSRQGPVLNFLQPEELKAAIDFTLADKPMSIEELSILLQSVLKYSVKTGHPYYFNTLFSGVDPYALTGAFLTALLNGNAYTFELAPVNTLIENELIEHIATKLIGFTQADGIFTPGGSLANITALNVARFKLFPDVRTQGMVGQPPLRIFTSTSKHYSIAKGASLLGLGENCIFDVPTDVRTGKMNPYELDNAILNCKKQGVVPLMVNVTAGTVVLGTFDNIDEIADICEKHSVWLHVDACWGGAVLMSDKFKHKMKGIDRVDSVAWDPHKMPGAGLQCAMFLTKHKGLLHEAHSCNAAYLFQPDKIYDTSYDNGDKSFQCGRTTDALKFWVQWKAYGNTGMAERIEACFDNALYLRDLVRDTEGFRLVVEEPECTNVCFWYIPERLRGQPETEQWWSEIAKVAPAVKASMQRSGEMMVSYMPCEDKVNFFRMVCSNPVSTKEDMQHVVNTIRRLGEEVKVTK